MLKNRSVVGKSSTIASVPLCKQQGTTHAIGVILQKYWLLYALFAPTLALIIVFNFLPNLMTVPLVFKKYYLLRGIWDSPWVGLANLEALFTSPDFGIVLRNTIVISVYRLVFGFFPPIILAILTHDLLSHRIKRITQSVTYLPHFLSWPIVYGIVLALINPANGVIITFLRNMGFTPENLLVSETFFRPLLIITAIWKEVGWGAIIYLAALAGIEPELYEAATVDGAEWYHRIFYITLPGIKPVVTLLLTLSLAGILSAGFEQVYLFYSPLTYSVGDIIDTWVYRRGLLSADFGLATAVGFFKSVIGFLLIITANKLAKRYAGQGIW
ncbi:MAG: ABC transporter permease subunit [Gemmatales bacterium]|nr:ABC transporter permease subunit [Gemmatales bacterium]